jgi:polysaccharide export outer membrane protein
MKHTLLATTAVFSALLTTLAAAAGPQAPLPQVASANGASAAKPPATAPAGVATPADFVIGPNDVLTVVFWRDKDMSGDVGVRPDGKISLPLLNDVQAAGLTPEQLRQALTAAAAKYVEDPSITVVVKEINSRRVFITGQVARPGPYALTGPTTVLQLISMAGGVAEYAHSKNITIMRTENGKPVSFRFNYKEVINRKNLKQNIELKPGDTVIVP